LQVNAIHQGTGKPRPILLPTAGTAGTGLHGIAIVAAGAGVGAGNQGELRRKFY
jgi:hypothetical protein